MNNKLSIIHNDGSIDAYGSINNDSIHSQNLLDYAKEKYPDDKVFKQLNYNHSAEVISYFFLVNHEDIVFLNTTKNTKRHGYTGILLLPNRINGAQKEGLLSFTNAVDKYKVSIAYDLTLEDGILDGKEITPEEYKNIPDILTCHFFGASKKRQK